MDILNDIERQDLEANADAIIDSEETEVTYEQVREWSDYDLLEWLVLWGNEQAIEIAEERL